MKAVVYTTDEGLSRIAEQNGWSAEKILETHTFPDGSNPRIVDNNSMPSHVLRDAWRDSGDIVDIDMPKSRDIANNLRREARELIFAPNSELILNDTMGIPLKKGQSVAAAKKANADYKKIDDEIQLSIEAANNESELIEIINDIG